MLHKMYMMFCCSSCESNVKEDDLIKGRLIESRHSIPLTCICIWLIFCGIPCGVDSCCLLWSYTWRRMLCSEGGGGRNDSTKAWWTPKLWNSQLPFWSMFFLNVVTFYEIWWKSNIILETQFGELPMLVWSCDFAFTTRPWSKDPKLGPKTN